MNASVQCLGLDDDFLLYRDFYFSEPFEPCQFGRLKNIFRTLYRLANVGDVDYDGLKLLSDLRVKNMMMVAIVCYCVKDNNHDHLRRSVMRWMEYAR